jgi:ketosteroid isomerase-like protein
MYQMKNNNYLSMTATAIALCLFSISCNTPTTDADAKQTIAKVADAVTNPLFSIAPVEYAGLAEKSLMLLSGLDFDAWAATLADDVTYSFPDGDQNTRTTLVGKKAIVD